MVVASPPGSVSRGRFGGLGLGVTNGPAMLGGRLATRRFSPTLGAMVFLTPVAIPCDSKKSGDDD